MKKQNPRFYYVTKVDKKKREITVSSKKPKKKKKTSTKKVKIDRVLKEWAKTPQDGFFEGAW